jgi:hypothetical protein
MGDDATIKIHITVCFLTLIKYRVFPRTVIICSWLTHCATNRKVAESIPVWVSGIFHWHNPVGRTMALGSTQPLTDMSGSNISYRVKVAGA